ncbi:MAG: type II toxin-antitoxin system VapC family toxin [Candidatus Thorarchaeota archaeon]
MAVFIDRNIIIALLNSRDKHHDKAKLLLTELRKPKYGMRVTTDYILDEVLTTLWIHTHRKNVVTKAHNLLRHTPEFIRMEYMTPHTLEVAWTKWEKLAKWPKKPLSFTDCCILSFMEKNDIPYLASFDSDFKGLVTLVEPIQ